ncbi:hypothetical protein C0Q70_15461 [Pomacea canaliculata]|uniref:Fibrinogen C-terminal domain-containing protein n=1 Tax=Pomacea canaliculata TaxID=400727 RepID=A0A2T7NUX9_POMCA|nr:hypothetical protein C0Q70_15461 [Pomacea canaliculata]
MFSSPSQWVSLMLPNPSRYSRQDLVKLTLLFRLIIKVDRSLKQFTGKTICRRYLWRQVTSLGGTIKDHGVAGGRRGAGDGAAQGAGAGHCLHHLVISGHVTWTGGGLLADITAGLVKVEWMQQLTTGRWSASLQRYRRWAQLGQVPQASRLSTSRAPRLPGGAGSDQHQHLELHRRLRFVSTCNSVVFDRAAKTCHLSPQVAAADCLNMEDIQDGRIYLQKVEQPNGTLLQAAYNNFKVKDEKSLYQFTFDSIKLSPSPAGDCLSDLRGANFSTYDSDNDGDSSVNCASRHSGGWWFRGNTCSTCNPTGQLLQPANGLRTGVDSEVFWIKDLGNVAPYRISMRLRPL